MGTAIVASVGWVLTCPLLLRFPACRWVASECTHDFSLSDLHVDYGADWSWPSKNMTIEFVGLYCIFFNVVTCLSLYLNLKLRFLKVPWSTILYNLCDSHTHLPPTKRIHLCQVQQILQFTQLTYIFLAINVWCLVHIQRHRFIPQEQFIK